MMDRRRRRWRVHIVLDRPLRRRRERLRRRIVLPLCLRRRTFIIHAPYRLGLPLMVITPAVEIPSAIASITSWLLVHYFWIAVAISSSAFIGSVRLWLRWRIVRARHSRHIVIGVDAPVASVSTGAAKSMLIAIANSASNRTSASSYGSTGHSRRLRMISYRSAIHNSFVCWR